ncbi:MAG: GNAT family protein [Bacteroidales bacterium]|nr:GNAT family protein [Bacteroidales bacterium]
MKLRAVELSDVDLLYEWENDIELWQVSNTMRPFSRYALEDYVLNSQNQSLYSAKQMRLMIDVEIDNAIFTIGCIDVYDYEAKDAKAGIGIFICKNERKKGYAQKAISLLENIMRNIYNIHQLYAFITEDNQKSIKLFEKSGYIFTSSLKDWVLTNSKYKNVNVYQKIF